MEGDLINILHLVLLGGVYLIFKEKSLLYICSCGWDCFESCLGFFKLHF